MPDYFFQNTQLLPSDQCVIEAHDRSYLLGDGIFETIKVLNSNPIYLGEHLHRLENSATFFCYPKITANLDEAISRIIEQNKITNGSLRVTISNQDQTPGLHSEEAKLSLLITFQRGLKYTPNEYTNGISTVVAKSTRRNEHSPLSFHKTTNYCDSIIARREAISRGTDDAILLNCAGKLCEGTVANLFVIMEDTILTPPISDGALPGITRARVIDLCQKNNLSLKEQSLSLSCLPDVRAAFFTNSLMGILPIRQIERYELPDIKKSPLLDQIKALLEQDLTTNS